MVELKSVLYGLGLLIGVVVLGFVLYKAYKYLFEPMELPYVYEKESLPVKNVILPENAVPNAVLPEPVVGPLREVEAEYPAIYDTAEVDIGNYVTQDNSYFEGDLQVTPL